MSLGEIHWIRRIPGYHYYDTPEDQDCLKKVIFMNKMGLGFGLFAGTLDIIGLSKPVGIANIAGRYAVITFPILATGSAFAAATCITANYRGKLDYWNSTIGAFVAGCTFGAAVRSGVAGTASSVLFAAFAYGLGSCEEMGITPYRKPDEEYPLGWGGVWNINRYDTSITKERPRGWKKADE